MAELSSCYGLGINESLLVDHGYNLTCESRVHGKFNTTMFALLFLCFLENLVIFSAAVLDRKRMRRENCIYICVISNIVMHMILAAIPTLNDIKNSFYPKYAGETMGRMTPFKAVDVLARAVSVTVMFGLCGNVLAIVFVRSDGGALLLGGGVFSKKRVFWYRKLKRKVLIGLVVYAWLTPSIMSLLATLFMNCATQCRCEMIKVVGDACPGVQGCSRIYTSFKIEYTLLAAGLWLTQITILIGFLSYAILKHINAFKQATSSTKKPTVCVTPNIVVKSFQTNRTTSDRNGANVVSPTIATTTEGATESTNTSISSTQSVLPKSKTRLSSGINHSIFFVILYVFCSTPGSVPSFIEPFYPFDDEKVRLIHIVSGMSVLIYTVLSPILMLAYIPSLMIALRNLLERIKRCCMPNVY